MFVYESGKKHFLLPDRSPLAHSAVYSYSG
jgi:hypothetical protein